MEKQRKRDKIVTFKHPSLDMYKMMRVDKRQAIEALRLQGTYVFTSPDKGETCKQYSPMEGLVLELDLNQDSPNGKVLSLDELPEDATWYIPIPVGDTQIVKDRRIEVISSIARKGQLMQSIADFYPDVRNRHTERDMYKRYIPTDVLFALQDEGMYAMLTHEFCAALTKWLDGRTILDPFAGRGWLGLGVSAHGGNVICSDDDSWNIIQKKQAVHTVDVIDAVASVKKYGKSADVLAILWAPNNNTIDYEVAKAMHEVNPNAIILYIGEDYGGCTSSNEFFHVAEPVKDPSFDVVAGLYYNVDGIHDEAVLYKYNPNF